MADLTSRWSELYAGDYQHTLLDRRRVQLTELLASIDNEGDDELALLNYMATKGKEELQPITDALLSGLEADEKKVSAISREIQKEALESLQQLHLALESQHQTLGAEHQELNRKLTALDDEHRGLETEYRTLGEKHQALVTKNASLQDFERKFNALSLQQASLEGLVRTETDEANLREFELLKGEHQTLRDQHKNVEEENGKLKTQMRGLITVEEENERLKTQLRGLRAVEDENERLKTQTRGLITVEEENERLKAQMRGLITVEEENERLKTQIRGFRAVEEENERLKTQLRGLGAVEEENERLKSQMRGLRAVEDENERLKTQLRGLGAVEEENERLKTQTRGLNDKLREEVENHDVLKNTNSRTNVAFRTAEEDIRILKKKYKDLEEIADDANSWKDKYNNAKRNLEDVAEKAQDWEKNHGKLSVELQASNSRAQEWEKKHGELSVELQTSNSHAQDWERMHSELSVELQNSKSSTQDWERWHGELSVELQNSKSSAQDWERWHGELSVELQASKSSAQDWEKRYSELSVELQASSASIRSLTYQATYADATFRDLREEDAHDLTLLHFHNSIVERHTKEIGRLGLELRANRQCLNPLFTQLAECHQAAMEGKHKTFAMTCDASFVKAMGVFKAGLKALQNDLVGALRQKNQLLSRLNTALGEAVQASSINGMTEQNARGDLETRLKAVLAHSEAIYAALGAENEREVNLHLTTLQEMHSCINPEQPWENIEMNCSRDEYAAQVTARVEALKERVYDVGDMVHELQKQEGRRIWANNALLLYNRVVTLESEMKELQEIMEEKDRIAWGLNAQVQQVRGFLVTLGVLEEEDGGDGEEDGGDGGNGGDEEEEEEDLMEVA